MFSAFSIFSASPSYSIDPRQLLDKATPTWPILHGLRQKGYKALAAPPVHNLDSIKAFGSAGLQVYVMESWRRPNKSQFVVSVHFLFIFEDFACFHCCMCCCAYFGIWSWGVVRSRCMALVHGIEVLWASSTHVFTTNILAVAFVWITKRLWYQVSKFSIA
jgi:hypothetical protein